MELVPLDVLNVLARMDISVYRGLVFTSRRFALSLDEQRVADFMAHFGFTVDVEDDCVSWSLNGRYHRVGGPAVVYNVGCKIWYRHGEICRPGGGLAIECAVADDDHSDEHFYHIMVHPKLNEDGTIKYCPRYDYI